MDYSQHKSILCIGKAELTENVFKMMETSYTQGVLVAQHYIHNHTQSGRKSNQLLWMKCLREQLTFNLPCLILSTIDTVSEVKTLISMATVVKPPSFFISENFHRGCGFHKTLCYECSRCAKSCFSVPTTGVPCASSEDCPAAASFTPSAETWPLFSTQHNCPHAAHVHVCSPCTLDGMYLVRHWKNGEGGQQPSQVGSR